MYAPHLVSFCLSADTSVSSDHCEEYCCERACTSIFLRPCFHFFRVDAQKRYCWIKRNPLVNFWAAVTLASLVAASVYVAISSAQTRVPACPSLHQYLFFSIFLRVASLLGSQAVAHCAFALPFPIDWWWRTSFHVLIGYLHIFLGKVFIQVLCPLLNRMICFRIIEIFKIALPKFTR